MTKKLPKIAVLIISYNGKRYLKGCFDSLLSLSNADCASIFLVDNNSTDGSLELAAKNYPSVKVINTGSNLGYAGAYNYAHNWLKERKLEFDYYFILNNDTVCVSKDLYERAIATFSDSTVGIVAPVLLDEKNHYQMRVGEYIFWSGTTLGQSIGKEYHTSDQKFISKWVSGAAFFIPTSLFEKLGGFEDYFMYEEDTAMSWRVNTMGLKIIYDNSISVIHFAGGTKKPSTFEHYYSERNRFIMYWQNLSTYLFFPFLPIFLLLRILILPMQLDFRIAMAKLRGLITGLSIFYRYPKRNNSPAKDLRVINFLCKRIADYEDPLSNS